MSDGGKVVGGIAIIGIAGIVLEAVAAALIIAVLFGAVVLIVAVVGTLKIWYNAFSESPAAAGITALVSGILSIGVYHIVNELHANNTQDLLPIPQPFLALSYIVGIVLVWGWPVALIGAWDGEDPLVTFPTAAWSVLGITFWLAVFTLGSGSHVSAQATTLSAAPYAASTEAVDVNKIPWPITARDETPEMTAYFEKYAVNIRPVPDWVACGQSYCVGGSLDVVKFKCMAPFCDVSGVPNGPTIYLYRRGQDFQEIGTIDPYHYSPYRALRDVQLTDSDAREILARGDP